MIIIHFFQFFGDDMAVFITGGAGYIGSHTVLKFLETEAQVIVLDNLSNSKKESLTRVENITGKRVKFYHGDIRDTRLLNTIFSENDIETVIHFAGLKSVGESIKYPLEYYDNNISGGLYLLAQMRKNNVLNFIFSSSATVYGLPETIPLTEECKVGGTTNAYGSSKLMFENILRDFSNANPDFRITVLRYFNPVGAHPSGQIGEDPNGTPNNLVPYITQVAIGKLACLSIFGNDYPTHDGTGVRDYIHVMDLAEGHLAAEKHKNDGECFKIYNLGTGKGYSVLDLIEAFESTNNIKIKYRFAPRRDGDIAECWSNPERAKNELSWCANYSLKEMMLHTWNWQVNNPDGYTD